MRKDAIFIAVEVDDQVAADTASLDHLQTTRDQVLTNVQLKLES